EHEHIDIQWGTKQLQKQDRRKNAADQVSIPPVLFLDMQFIFFRLCHGISLASKYCCDNAGDPQYNEDDWDSIRVTFPDLSPVHHIRRHILMIRVLIGAVNVLPFQQISEQFIQAQNDTACTQCKHRSTTGVRNSSNDNRKNSNPNG
ncbi:MAG: hypothetical protein IKS29_06135, partial [Oscillospiraceae bacterium]|nr:hypothetical protein [Oscillospiraceae bacterium]